MQQPDELISDKEFMNEHVESILFHSIIVSHFAYRVGKELDLSDDVCYELAYAGIMHDIGKIHLDYQLRILEESKLNKHDIGVDTKRYVRNHSIDSYNILKDTGCSQYVLDAVLYHHENYDGTGYPEGLNAGDIPHGARVLRVCDVFAALIDRRVYRAAMDLDAAVATMIDEVKNYDMKVFLAFQRVINEESIKEFIEWINIHNIHHELKTKRLEKKILKQNKKRYKREKY